MRRLHKRSVTIAGHRTSLSLEAPFWEALKELAEAEGVSLAALIERVDRERSLAPSPYNEGRASNLSSAARVYVLERVRETAAPNSA